MPAKLTTTFLTLVSLIIGSWINRLLNSGKRVIESTMAIMLLRFDSRFSLFLMLSRIVMVSTTWPWTVLLFHFFGSWGRGSRLQTSDYATTVRPRAKGKRQKTMRNVPIEPRERNKRYESLARRCLVWFFYFTSWFLTVLSFHSLSHGGSL